MTTKYITFGKQKHEITGYQTCMQKLSFLPDAQPFGDLEVDSAWFYTPGGSLKKIKDML